MSMTYTDWINAVATLLSYDSTITNASSATPSTYGPFNLMIQRAIEYGEQRLYRELDLLVTRVSDSGTATAGQRSFSLPMNGGTYVVLEQVAAVVGGVQQSPMLPMSKEALEAFYPSDTPIVSPSVPTMWCPVDQTSILVAPPPDIGYTLKTFGTKRPAPLSAANTTTFLTIALPDLFLCATMIFWSGYQRDFGAQSDDPKVAQSWESQYQLLNKSAEVEEARKKFYGPGWSARNPSPLATPPQT